MNVLAKHIAITIAVFLFVSCGKKQKEVEIGYTQVFQELIMEDISLDSLSRTLNITPETLIKMQYGLWRESSELNEVLKESKRFFDQGDSKKAIKTLQKKHKFSLGEITENPSFSLKEYKELATQRNDRFQESVTKIVRSYFHQKVQKFMSNNFGLLDIPSLIFNRLFRSKDRIINNYKKKIEKSISKSELEEKLLFQLNSYKNFILTEKKVLFKNNTNLPDFKKIDIDNIDININDELEVSFINRSTNELYGMAMDLVLELIIFIVCTIIIGSIVNKEIQKAKRRSFNDFYNIYNKKSKNKGFLGKALTFAVLAVGTVAMSEEKAREIKRKYTRYKVYWITCLTITFFIISYFLIESKSVKYEKIIEENLTVQVDNYIEKTNIWTIPIFNKMINDIK